MARRLRCWRNFGGRVQWLFHKGVIQLAGAFVHRHKHRLRPTAVLFRLAEGNLKKYPARHESLDIPGILRVIEQWLDELETGNFQVNSLISGRVAKL